MPKYSDYIEWENYRDKRLEEIKRLRNLGIPTFETVPALPSEGITKWLEKNQEGLV
jgi:hypothetical protein